MVGRRMLDITTVLYIDSYIIILKFAILGKGPHATGPQGIATYYFPSNIQPKLTSIRCWFFFLESETARGRGI